MIPANINSSLLQYKEEVDKTITQLKSEIPHAKEIYNDVKKEAKAIASQITNNTKYSVRTFNHIKEEVLKEVVSITSELDFVFDEIKQEIVREYDEVEKTIIAVNAYAIAIGESNVKTISEELDSTIFTKEDILSSISSSVAEKLDIFLNNDKQFNDIVSDISKQAIDMSQKSFEKVNSFESVREFIEGREINLDSLLKMDSTGLSKLFGEINKAQSKAFEYSENLLSNILQQVRKDNSGSILTNLKVENLNEIVTGSLEPILSKLKEEFEIDDFGIKFDEILNVEDITKKMGNSISFELPSIPDFFEAEDTLLEPDFQESLEFGEIIMDSIEEKITILNPYLEEGEMVLNRITLI